MPAVSIWKARPIGLPPEAPMTGPVYALNLFNVADRAEYLAYSRRSSKEVEAHGGRVIALGRFQEAVAATSSRAR
jgi:uncharacterized protein (DUF1330 family)